MEEEVRRILRERLDVAPVTEPENWVGAIRALVEPLWGIDLPEIDRDKLRDPLGFSGPDWDAES